MNGLTKSLTVHRRVRLLGLGALIAAAALMVSLSALSASARAAKPHPTTTIVLVHGAFASPGSDPKPKAQARILRAATELLATGGRDAVTTRAVSAAAGVQPPTIYRHFGDMQGLFEAVARDMRFERGVELDRAGFLRPALDARFR